MKTQVKLITPELTPLAMLELGDWFWHEGKLLVCGVDTFLAIEDGTVYVLPDSIRVTKIPSVAISPSVQQVAETERTANKVG